MWLGLALRRLAASFQVLEFFPKAWGEEREPQCDLNDLECSAPLLLLCNLHKVLDKQVILFQLTNKNERFKNQLKKDRFFESFIQNEWLLPQFTITENDSHSWVLLFPLDRAELCPLPTPSNETHCWQSGGEAFELKTGGLGRSLDSVLTGWQASLRKPLTTSASPCIQRGRDIFPPSWEY